MFKGTNYSNAWAILKRRDGNLLLEFLPVGGGLAARSALDATRCGIHLESTLMQWVVTTDSLSVSFADLGGKSFPGKRRLMLGGPQDYLLQFRDCGRSRLLLTR